MAGSADVMFLPTIQPEITSKEYNKYQYFAYQGLDLSKSGFDSFSTPLIKYEEIETWAQSQGEIKGSSPRWIVPVVLGKIDSLVLVSDVKKEL